MPELFQQLHIWVILSLTLIFLVAIISFTLIAKKGFKYDAKSTAMTFAVILQGGNFIRIATVILVVLATIYVSVIGIVKGDGVIAIFGSIIGYVLGGMERAKKVSGDQA